MVTEAIIDICKGFAVWVIGLLPNLTGFQLFSGIGKFIDLASYAFYFIPLPAFVFALTLILVFEKANVFMGALTWILRRIPGQG